MSNYDMIYILEILIKPDPDYYTISVNLIRTISRNTIKRGLPRLTIVYPRALSVASYQR